MNMTKMISKSRKAGLSGLCLLLPPVLFFILFIRPPDMGSADGRGPEVQTVQLGNGWGYQIVMNRKVLIYQPTIPAIDTAMAFPDEAAARKVGNLVLERLNANRDFSVTQEDLRCVLDD